MPATTAKGYPYPLPADPVSDTDLAIKALAEKVETEVGRRKRGIFGGQAGATGLVNIPHGLGATPTTVFLQSTSGSNTVATIEAIGSVNIVAMVRNLATAGAPALTNGIVYMFWEATL